MNQFFQTSNQSLSSLPTLRQQRRQLFKVFWFIAVLLFIFELFWTQTDSLITNFGAILITAAALLPSYLWCSGRALGMPIFPLFALTYIWTYGLPLVTEHPQVLTYSTESQLFASITVAGFLGLGTIIWFGFVKSPPPLPKSYRALSTKGGDAFFLFALGIGVLFNIVNNGGWLVSFLQGGFYTAFRAAILGLTALASFVLAYKLGNQELSKNKSRLFLTLLVAYIVTDAVGLLLIGAASTFVTATAGFIFGRQKIPTLPIIITIICLSFLHYGKSDMRNKYWFKEQPNLIQPWQYPAWYGEWVGYSWDYLNKKDDVYLPSSQEKESFFERSSTIHMLLLAQDQTPTLKPFLYGKTYAILPELVIPRIFNFNKIRSHEGTHILSIYYGLQTLEATYTTSISWGLLAESYANFGELGCAGLAIVLGIIYGKVTRWSINAPILSAQSLFAVLVLTLSFQTEWTAGVYVAALFQSGIVLGAIVIFMMKTFCSPRFQAYKV
ncbi:MAG: hypothetical protein WBA41_17415 [Rivularia sp. (in: cyanobacteria)]